MLVDKIPWVSHGGAGTPLYSLDIHPNGSRLATSGSDHKVKIWRLAAILNVKAEASSKTSRLLATLADHGGPVNVIRFSHSGRFLATASDDKVIAVLELRGGQAQASFGNSDGPNIENWKVVLTLRGHSAGIPDLNCVVDLAWTPDGYTLLASSMDGTVAAFSFTEIELGKAVSDDDLEKTKKELHGIHATHALRFAESAEQQHMAFGEDSPVHVLPSPGLLTSGNSALAGRLAPEHGVPSDLQPGPSQQAQVAKRRISPDPVGSVPTGTHVSSAAWAKSRPPVPPRPPKPPSSLPNGSAAGPGATAGSKRKASELPMPTPARRRVTPESLPAPTGQPGSELGKEPIPLGDQAEGGSRVLEAVLRSAAAFETAVLQVYTPAGRRMLPALKLSAPPVSLSSDGGWRLMVVCRDGSLRVWDLQALTVHTEISLLSLVAATPAGTAVRQVQLSKDGGVHALLSNRTAWLWHTGLACWLCLADSAFAASPFTSLLPLNPALQGDLGRIQQQASSSGRGLPPGTLLSSTGSLRTGLGQGRGHLEANMAAALALQSPEEYKRWLSTYASHLAGEGDAVRLRELCIELLGNGQHSSSAQAMDTGWSPTVCGLDKRRLLQDEVLKRLGLLGVRPAAKTSRQLQSVISAAADSKTTLDSASRSVPLRSLYSVGKAIETGNVKVSDLHTVHYQVYGNPQGQPALVVHGGPGAGCYTNHARFFDLQHWKVVLVDQRGCGSSTPLGCLVDNNTQALIDDYEKLRKRLKIKKWMLFGGSWGVSLSLAYAQQHAAKVSSIVLRGVCLMRPSEIDWMFGGGAGHVQPLGWHNFKGHIPKAERDDIVAAYHKRLTSPDIAVRDAAAKAWLSWEHSVGSARTSSLQALLECHYSHNHAFLRDPLLQGVDQVRHIPCIAVQGRLDYVCPVVTAYDLHCEWPEMELRVVPNAGHSMYDSGITHELLEATDRLRKSSARIRAAAKEQSETQRSISSNRYASI
ncbi:hypothetical protein WJX79_010832 [Trebouxia sp. C0005]